MTAGSCTGMVPVSATAALGRRGAAAAVFCSLLGWQAYLSLQVFGPADPWATLRNDDPVVSGQHPLHYYHAEIGARASGRSRGFVCFDPTFQAGYPKTPVSRSGCSAAELGALLTRQPLQPCGYKLGIWLSSSLLPAGFWIAAATLGLCRWSRALAFGIGIFIWWGDPGRRLLEIGDVNAQALAVLTVVHLSLLARYHHRPDPVGLIGPFVTSAWGWYLSPPIWAGVSLLSGGFWLGVGRRHRLSWHAGLLGAQAAALAVAARWVVDWGRFWWICVPIRPLPLALPCPDWSSVWTSAFLGSTPLDRLAYGILLLVGATGGVRCLIVTQQRASAWLCLAGAGILAAAIAGALWPPLRPFGTNQFLFAAICLAVIPASQSIAVLARWTVSSRGRRIGTAALVIPPVLAAGLLIREREIPVGLTTWGPRPLTIGRPDRAAAFVDWAREQTSAAARIVWEDQPGIFNDCWSVFLAPWSGRPFLGALDAQADTEHGFMTLKNGILAGRPISAWTDDELETYCRRFNVGWFVCATEPARARLARFALAEVLPPPQGWQNRSFFAVRRPHNYLLRGTARGLALEPQRIVLTDVVPENGVVLLSLHFQHGWRVRPGWVQVEREPDPYDPIPFLRLRLPGPAAHITLTWEDP